MINDPRQVLDARPMGARQWLIIVLCILLNALDGFDVLSISFAAPGIASEWGIDRTELGVVLSMELVGMAAGSILFGQLADRWGRRPIILVSVALITVGMALAWHSDGILDLAVYRLVTGFGIGGILATTTSVAAEFANARYRNLCVSLTSSGYPLGAFVGGAVAASIVDGGWRSVFLFGATATASMLPLLFLFVPESPAYLAQRCPGNALAQINSILRQLRQPAIDSLAPAKSRGQNGSLRNLFTPDLVRTTIIVTLAYFAHVGTFYFMMKWVPKIVVDYGFAASAAGGVLVSTNAGGTVGSIIVSLLTRWIPVRATMFAMLTLSALMVAAFGLAKADLWYLSVIGFSAGFGMSGTVVGFYATIVRSYPTRLRTSGVGFAIGVGRAGSALSPILAGALFALNLGLPLVAGIMAMGSAAALCLLVFLKEWPSRTPV